jgi:hypothetical protein
MFGWASMWVLGLLAATPVQQVGGDWATSRPSLLAEEEMLLLREPSRPAHRVGLLRAEDWTRIAVREIGEGPLVHVDLLDRMYRAEGWFGLSVSPRFAILVDVRFDATPASNPASPTGPEIAASLGLGVSSDLQVPRLF